MLSYELAEPYDWDAPGRDEYVQSKVLEICESIATQGERSQFKDVFDNLFEYVSENLEKFLGD